MQKSLFFLLFILISSLVKSQHVEIGVFGGSSYYLGELNPGVPFINKPRPFIGVLYRKNWSKRYALRLSANYGKLAAEDKMNSSEWSEFRTLSFSSSILEASGVLEFNFLPYQINNYNTSPFTPFVYIGVAAFQVKPTIKNTNTGAEVKGSSLIAPSVPFGFGFKLDFIRNLGLSIDWGVRKTFTDEVDGLGETYLNGYQLSNSGNNDWYSFVGISLNYKILTKRDRCPVAK
ncbi:MAG: hypothetical protein H6587_08080 [Flavobacteriales bacterium]|nr:hypothetical protein [Flavobacteriales bacterium]MCB9364511.1 hypothetical protein [Flavobacteriales bacterium]